MIWNDWNARRVIKIIQKKTQIYKTNSKYYIKNKNKIQYLILLINFYFKYIINLFVIKWL